MFSATVGGASTLGTLILAEVIGLFSERARTVALNIIIPGLLVLVILVIPWLECKEIVHAAGLSFQRNRKGQLPRWTWIVQSGLFKGWMAVFWLVGNVVPIGATTTRTPSFSDSSAKWTETITTACLERLGIIGITLMALLAGFASVSSPWHAYNDARPGKKRAVTEADVQRKEAGLEAANEMLLTKRHRLQFLERKVSAQTANTNSSSFMGKMLGSIRGASNEEAEMRSLRVEIAGLETMEANLSSNVSLMKNQRAAAARAATPLGRLLLAPSYIFSAYCVYRVIATCMTTLRRAYSPSASFASSDPINRFLGLLAKHWDPTLDQIAWARTISFALTGVILVASANSVVQTFHLFAKWTPGLLHHAQANLALAIGQVAATYVISSSLLLRSHLPVEASSAVGGILRGALSPAFVDGWFESWFLLGSLATGLGIALGRQLSGDDEWDDLDMEEMNIGAKRS